jgi:hypothetical protein
VSVRHRRAVPPPAVVVTFELEAKPKVRVAATREQDFERLLTWLESQDDLVELVRRAIELERSPT